MNLNKNTFQSLAANRTGLIRNDTMEGRNYIVTPMIMLLEGVHQGSGGPLYYPPEELSKTPVVWNHKPVVVYHPQVNGVGVSACMPDILTSRKIGVIMNTVFEDGKLKAEAWIDLDRAKAVDERIVSAIENKAVMELSTGLFTDNENVEGEWRGEKYIAIARNYRPDHLALLPDIKGACSIEDGAGFLRLNSQKNCIIIDVDKIFTKNNRKEITMNKEKIVQSLIKNEMTNWKDEDKDVLMELEESVLEKMVPIEINKEKEPEKPAKTEAVTNEVSKEKPITVEKFIAEQVPSELQAVLMNGLRSYNKEKTELIKSITDNQNNKFTEDQLKSKDNEELRNISLLANSTSKEQDVVRFINYSGQGDPVNVNAEVKMEPLSLPTIDFSKK